MKTHILISCVSKKLDRPAPAKDLYTSPLFKFAYQYATSLKPDTIFILSAKHGLLSCDEVIAPYNETLNKMKAREVEIWAKQVLTELTKRTDLENDNFVLLAGEKYRKYLMPHLKHYRVPMKGLGIGEQLSWLKGRGLGAAQKDVWSRRSHMNISRKDVQRICNASDGNGQIL